MQETFKLIGETVSKKNSNKFNSKSKLMYKTKGYMTWYQGAVMQLRPQIKTKGIDYPVEISMLFVHGDKRRRDSDNGQTSILDLLVREGVIVDDNWFIVRRLVVDNDFEKGNPHCVITIKNL
jgi:Holliday junction resolvase RusA-like endonuclease